MIELEPAAPELIALYREGLEERRKIVYARPSKFSDDLRGMLLKLVKDAEAVDLIEYVASKGDFGNAREIRGNRDAVIKLLNKRGVSRRPGKRPTYGLAELVGSLTPLFLYFGVNLATGENTLLVGGLRAVALEMCVSGDPRDELRRLMRIRRRSSPDEAKRVVFEAFARGLSR